MVDKGNAIMLWSELKKKSGTDTKELANLMRASGYLKTEIKKILKTVEDPLDEQSINNKLEEEMLLRHKLRTRILSELLEKENINVFSIIHELRKEDEHILDQLIKLGTISPPIPTFSGISSLENIIYSGIKNPPIIIEDNE